MGYSGICPDDQLVAQVRRHVIAAANATKQNLHNYTPQFRSMQAVTTKLYRMHGDQATKKRRERPQPIRAECKGSRRRGSAEGDGFG